MVVPAIYSGQLEPEVLFEGEETGLFLHIGSTGRVVEYSSILQNGVMVNPQDIGLGGVHIVVGDEATMGFDNGEINIADHHAKTALGGPDDPSAGGGTMMHHSHAHEGGVGLDIMTSSSSIMTHMTSPLEITMPQKKALGKWSLAVIAFYSVSGGPFGMESSVKAAGPFFALLGFLVMPLIWSLPEAMVVAELGSAYPEASGGVVWVEEAFGTTAGCISGYLSYVAGATDNAIYPVLFLEYLLTAVNDHHNDSDSADNAAVNPSQEIHGFLRFALLTGTSILLAYVNYRGLDLVGNMAIVVCAVSMSPFLVMCIWGIPQVEPHRWFQMPEPPLTSSVDESTGWFPNYAGVLWRPFLNNLFWNLNSFDSAGSFAGEVNDVGSTFPKAMFLSVIMVVLSYFLPLLIAVGATDGRQSDWVDGYLTTVALKVAGPWLAGWVVFSAGISNLALFQAEMSSDAFQVMGMADRGYLPPIFSTRSKYDTPTYGIMLGTCIIIAMSLADFWALVEMLNFNYSISLLFEFSAFIKLRISKPHLHRPYRIPLGTAGCLIFLIPTCLMILLVMALASYMTYVYFLGVVLLGMILSVISKNTRAATNNPLADPHYNPISIREEEVLPTTADTNKAVYA